MTTPRVPLFARLPGIYQDKDAQQSPPHQLQAYLAAIEGLYDKLHADIEGLYRDFFIETCDAWVIPYLGQLLGVDPLVGHSTAAYRADVATAIRVRRSKGTLSAIQMIAEQTTQWEVHAAELRQQVARFTPLNQVEGAVKIVSVRDPASLPQLFSPNDQTSRLPDFSGPNGRRPIYNLPNVALFFWRLRPFMLREQIPSLGARVNFAGAQPPRAQRTGEATYAAAFYLDPLQRRLPLQNIEAVSIQWPSALGMTTQNWPTRRGNLCAWIDSVMPPIRAGEVIVDEKLGRIACGCPDEATLNALCTSSGQTDMKVNVRYRFAGEVGAHPVARSVALPDSTVKYAVTKTSEFVDALQKIIARGVAAAIEIQSSSIIEWNPGDIDASGAIPLSAPLTICAADGERPLLRLKGALKFRPQAGLAAHLIHNLAVHLEGLWLTRADGFSGTALIEQVALDHLSVVECTLDPGGQVNAQGQRIAPQTSLSLDELQGFATRSAFQERPSLYFVRSILGSIRVQGAYDLSLQHSIVDAGRTQAAIGPQGANSTDWASPVSVEGVTVFGKIKVERLSGLGLICTDTIEVWNNQEGCLKYSTFAAGLNRLPQNYACVKHNRTDTLLRFSSEAFGEAAYAQLALDGDENIRARGPDDNEMGAFGFLNEADKWRNLKIRLRDAFPLAVQPLLIPVN